MERQYEEEDKRYTDCGRNDQAWNNQTKPGKMRLSQESNY
jgi:hypothetical protein